MYMSYSLSLHDVVGSRPHKRRRFSLHDSEHPDDIDDLEIKSMTEGARLPKTFLYNLRLTMIFFR